MPSHGGRVRDPLFTGRALVAVGTTASSPTRLGVLAAAFPFAVIVVAAHEAPYLLAALGAGYVAYASRTGRFVPGIGRLGVAAGRPGC